MTDSRRIVLASRNPHKLAEMQAILHAFRVVPVTDFEGLEDVIEDAPTLEGNALKKARYTWEKTGLPALADDTGLEVDALNGQPGVFSARYAGAHATYSDNVSKLLAELQSFPKPEDRRARFRTVIAYVDGENEWIADGIIEGRITPSPSGRSGFGYDPVFLPEGYNETFAEMPASLKNEISHRARALTQMVRMLRTLLQP